MEERLPEEMAMECLIRVPHQSFADLRRVCRRWKQELDSPLFHRDRCTAGSTRSLVILSQAQHAASPAAGLAHKPSSTSFPAQRLVVLDPSSGHWDCLPDIPCLPRGLPLFCGLAATARELAVVGGWDPHTLATSDAVYVYSFLTGAWSRGRPMPGPRRSFFACAGGGGGMVFVAGGHDEDKNALRSAMVYDVGQDEWTELPEMARERDECAGLFFGGGGVFRVVGGYCTAMQGSFGRSAEEFDVDEWRWRPVEEAAMEAGESPRTCTTVGWDGRMYMCVEAGRVLVAEGEGKWKEVAELPEDARVAQKIVACRRGLVVVGAAKAGGEQAAYILVMSQGKGEAAEAAWQRLEVPPEYSGHVQGGCCLEI